MIDTDVIDIDKMVKDTSVLITLPEIYLKIRALMDDPASCLDDFAMVTCTDQGLVASVLKIVNSAYYGFTGQINNLNRALNLIGIGQLHDLVLSISVINSTDLPNDIEKLTVFWQRSIYCGVFSRLLAKKVKLQDADSLFVIGLLHNLGRLILFLKYPRESSQAIIRAQTENLSLTEIERSTFGFDYSQVGQALLSEWNLPQKFQLVTGQHTEPDNATEYLVETQIVHIAHMLATNKFPGADNYHYQIDRSLYKQLNIKDEDIHDLCTEADDISLEFKKLILDGKY